MLPEEREVEGREDEERNSGRKGQTQAANESCSHGLPIQQQVFKNELGSE
jgi:hypothetical protein